MHDTGHIQISPGMAVAGSLYVRAPKHCEASDVVRFR
jgi:hypothetical protein